MKTNKFIAAALVLAMSVACTANGGKTTADQAGADSLGTVKPVNPKSLLPSRAERDSVSYLLGINFGSFLKGYNFGEDINYAQVKAGIRDFMKAEGDQRDSNFVKQFKISPEKMNELFNSFLSKRHEYTLALNSEKETKFLKENKGKDSVVVTESGLQYIIREAGNDVKAGPKDTIFVHYKGVLTNGTVFDETKMDQPSARLVMDRVVKGWTEGLQLVGEGGKIKLFIPSALAYGENGANGIEPNSPLIFDVQIDSVRHFVEKPIGKVK